MSRDISHLTEVSRPAVSPTSLTPSEMYNPKLIDPRGDSWGDRAKLEFAPNLKEGMAQAQREGKALVAIFEEDYCGWCKKFEEELQKPGAAGMNRDAVFVRLTPSRDPEAKALADGLGVNAYPTISIMRIHGADVNESSRITGFTTMEDLAAKVKPRNILLA